MNKTETYSLQQAATILGVHASTIYRQAQKSQIPAIRVGGRWVLPRTYVDSLFAAVGQPRAEASSRA